MLQAFADPILPIFAVLVAGFLLCRAKVFDNGHAAAINRFVFYLSAPALVFAVFAKAPLDNLSLTVLASYFGAEMVIYAGITLLARYGFGLDWAESILLGMAAVFSNHVFFVLPIAVLAYGSDVSVTIGGVILVDAITFCLTVFLVDAASSTGSGLGNAAKGLLRNPFVYAPVLGALAWGLGDWMPSGVMTFADFAGDAAAPVALFALGVVMAGLKLRPIGLIVLIVVAAKLVLHPLLVALGVSVLGDPLDWGTIAILVAAGPCGAMPFVIAVQYAIPVDRIAKAMLISMVLSVFSLSLLI